jgi:hypothetical protein
MRLSDWVRESGIKPTTPTTETGAVSLVILFTDPNRDLLFQLEDYKVSSSCGVVIWLVPSPEELKRRRRNHKARQRRSHLKDALESIGVKQVRGALGGTYYE